jgi:hypothetical protein
MNKANVFLLSVILATGTLVYSAAAAETAEQIRSQEIVGTIVGVDLENSAIELQYELDEMTRQMKVDTFYITDATMIDVAMVKSTLNDLKIGNSVLLEYAQMPDGAKVVESVWVKKS